jgi:hypothetical protein
LAFFAVNGDSDIHDTGTLLSTNKIVKHVEEGGIRPEHDGVLFVTMCRYHQTMIQAYSMPQCKNG